MRTARLQRLVMRGTAIFILPLIQHAVVTVRCALSAIPESLVIPIMRRGTQQRCAQHIRGQAQHAAQPRQVDDVQHRRHAFMRINFGTNQMEQGVAGERVGTGELPRIETRDSPGINHPRLKTLPRANEIRHSSNGRIGKRGGLSAAALRRGKRASGGMAGLNVAAVVHRVGPQS